MKGQQLWQNERLAQAVAYCRAFTNSATRAESRIQITLFYPGEIRIQNHSEYQCANLFICSINLVLAKSDWYPVF
jgi:hypothetical protein